MSKQPDNNQVNDVVAALGGFAEMTHIFYDAMIATGATHREANSAMTAFVAAFWHEQMEDARRGKGGQQSNEQEA